MHEIEGLVEDSVHLVNQAEWPRAEKLALIKALYRLQSQFDTGYTHFRVIDILLKLGFTFRVALSEHPDFASHGPELQAMLKSQRSAWLPANMAHPESARVFAQQEEGGSFLYFDVGDVFWRRRVLHGYVPADEEPQALGIVGLVRKMLMLTLAANADNDRQTALRHQWFSVFSTHALAGYWGEDDGLKSGFEGWVANEDLLAIRALMLELDWPKSAPKRDRYFPVPKLSEELRHAGNLDQAYQARLLLEPAKSVDDLHAALEKDLAKERGLGERLKCVKKIIGRDLEDCGWKLAWETVDAAENEWRWLWYANDPDAPSDDGVKHRLLFLATYTKSAKWLDVTVGMQHAKLLRWQQRSPDTCMKGVHFYGQLTANLDDEWVDANKRINGFGVWELRPTASEKVWSDCLREVVGQWPKGLAHFRTKVLDEFPAKTLDRGFDAILATIEKDGVIPDHILFHSSFSYGLVFYFDALERNDLQAAKRHLDWLEQKVTPRMKEHNAWYMNELAPFLDAARAGNSVPMPLIPHPKYDLF